VAGPLCDQLPSGDQPGNPAFLRSQAADVALTWIPVIENFEAATRAAGLKADLHDADGVTILAPTDDAYTARFTQDTIDDLLLNRQDELRDLLEAHIVDEALSLEQMRTAGSVTTRSGDTLAVTAAGTNLRIDDRAETVCADYQVANARIHVIDNVLGELPDPAPSESPTGG
jgi:uncharacterized surface protein with fasciclin (FAS1) repeats